MTLKKLTNWNGHSIILDAERVISVSENDARITYTEDHQKIYNLNCTVMLHGESASNEASQGFVVLGTHLEVLQQLGLTLS